MKYLKTYKKFSENADAFTTTGMGSVTSAQPGTPAGTLGTEGSGDISFVFKKEKRKKGGPSEVSDLRDLEPAKCVTKVDDINKKG